MDKDLEEQVAEFLEDLRILFGRYGFCLINGKFGPFLGDVAFDRLNVLAGGATCRVRHGKEEETEIAVGWLYEKSPDA